MSDRRPRWLVFGVGNPSRGDDALGPLLIERLEHWAAARRLPMDLALLTDFQWQIEHALDLAGVDVTIFADASATAAPPFELVPLRPHLDFACSTHALAPESVLAVAERLGQALPQAWLLALPGRDFALGAQVSREGWAALEAACAFLSGAIAAARLAR